MEIFIYIIQPFLHPSRFKMLMVILILLLSMAVLYIKVIKPYSTWTRRGIKQTNPPYLLGDSAKLILGRQSTYDMIKCLYNSYPTERYFGMYRMFIPTLMIRDPELIKTLTIKDFDHFFNRRQFLPDGVEPMWSKNLLSMRDAEWKHMRMALTPSFTSSKMRGIFDLISECCDIYIKYFQNDNVMKSVELKDLATRYTNDLIATVAFGIKCDSINDKENEFFIMARSINEVKSWRTFAFLLYMVFPNICKILNVRIFPRKITNFFSNVVKDTIRIREELGIVRPDMIHLLMETRKENSSKTEFSDEDIAAQAFIFYLGGFETVASALQFMGHALVINSDIQKKLQQEIDLTLKDCNGKLTYDALMKMKYLDMVVCETLRKWPSIPALERICTKEYTLYPSNNREKPLQIFPKEVLVFPIVALQHDSEYFPNPDKFDPERFSDKNRPKINPYVYLPFGSGPRNCIGSRLALLEIKIFYFYFLSNFDFIATEKTENELVLEKRSFAATAQNEIWIAMKPRIK